MSNFQLTIVVDNNAAEGLVAEHGFSLHLRTPGGNMLLDAGNKEAFNANAKRLGVDLGSLSGLVLSHGHYDHTGGVDELLRQNKKLDVYLHAAVFQPRYSIDQEKPTIVKMPLAAMEALMRHPDQHIHWLTKSLSPLPGVGIAGPIPRRYEFEDTGGSFYLDPEGNEIDTIQDDTAVWLHGPDGLVICVGCCHAGLVNTLNHIVAKTGEHRIQAIVGGLHLLNASIERLDKTIKTLSTFSISKIVACHCSGADAVQYLSDHLRAEVSTGYAGMVLDF